MLSINTNLSSIIAQRSMKQSTNSLNQAIERMTTGAKINHAKDNAANYNIATNMTTKLGALQVAEDNCAMGLDTLATANGVLEQMSSLTSKLRSLVVQAQNGTYGEQSIDALNKEASVISETLLNLYTKAEYNGIKLLRSDDLGYKVEGDYNRFINNPVDYTDEEVAAMTPLSGVDPTLSLLSGQYSISTPEELKKLADMTNDGKLYSGTAEFVLACDIDLSGYSNGNGWIAIGANSGHGEWFSGVFNGNGHVIRNLYANRSDYYVGLFGGCIGSGAEIKNLGVEDCNILNKHGSGTTGAIASGNIIISNCWATGSVEGKNSVGGIAGRPSGGLEVRESWFTGCVKGETNVGGISACPYGKISNCRADAKVVGINNVGGIVGKNNYKSIMDCLFIGTVEGDTHVGGIIGEYSLANNVNTVCSNNISLAKIIGIDNVGSVIGSITNLQDENTLKKLSVSNTIIKEQDLDKIGGLYLTDGTSLDKSIATTQLSGISFLKIPSPILNFQIGTSGDAHSGLALDTTFKGATTVDTLQKIDVKDVSVLANIDDFLDSINTKQVELGATENRLNSALEEISTQYENLLSSRSTLHDADIAEVSSEYIRQQILQQASATLLSTANQSASIALSLI